jgi:glyoxylase-like metal-dependent hydrolase (beta-lactamase superfamily II)
VQLCAAHTEAQNDRSITDALTVLEVRPSIYMIAGAGSNVVAHIGRDGVIVVDTGSAERAADVLAEIEHLTDSPVRYIINTSADPDHVGGNALLSAAGQPLTPTGYRRFGIEFSESAPILAEERVLARMSATTEEPSYSAAGWPTTTYAAAWGEPQRKLVLSGEAIQVMHQPAAHTDGDSIVYFRRSDVLVTGDIVDIRRFPVIDLENGGTVQGLLESLNRIVDMTFSSTPFPYQKDGTVIVSGHGRLCTTTDVIDYRDMVTIVRDRIQDLISQGRSLREIQRANPTAGYRRRYGADTGDWTTEMFVEAIFRSLIDGRKTE